MLLNRNTLSRRLHDQIDGRYLIFGKELFLVERCGAVIREQAKKKDYLERIALNATQDFDWKTFKDHLNSQSLFSSKKIIELRLPQSGRPGLQGAQALVDSLESQDLDTIVVVIAGSLDTTIKRSKWFKAWEKRAIVVDNPELNSKQFQDWIKGFLNRNEIKHESEVVGRLAYYFEGNMLAAANEIRKLMMSYDGTPITVAMLERIIKDQARFSVFALTDACLAGKAERAVRLLRALRNEGAEPIVVLWALAREARIIYKVAFATAKGHPLNQIFQQLRVWQSRQNLLTAAARRLGTSGSIRTMRQIARADRVLKGRDEAPIGGSIWNEYERIVLAICGVQSV